MFRLTRNNTLFCFILEAVILGVILAPLLLQYAACAAISRIEINGTATPVERCFCSESSLFCCLLNGMDGVLPGVDGAKDSLNESFVGLSNSLSSPGFIMLNMTAESHGHGTSRPITALPTKTTTRSNHRQTVTGNIIPDETNTNTTPYFPLALDRINVWAVIGINVSWVFKHTDTGPPNNKDEESNYLPVMNSKRTARTRIQINLPFRPKPSFIGCGAGICPEARGLFASNDGCGYFLNCWDFCGWTQSCPGNLVLDITKKWCEWPWRLPTTDACFAKWPGWKNKRQGTATAAAPPAQNDVMMVAEQTTPPPTAREPTVTAPIPTEAITVVPITLQTTTTIFETTIPTTTVETTTSVPSTKVETTSSVTSTSLSTTLETSSETMTTVAVETTTVPTMTVETITSQPTTTVERSAFDPTPHDIQPST